MALGVGEALVSTLDEKATPKMVQKAFIYPPQSAFSPMSQSEVDSHIKDSVLFGVYEKEIDRESAYEILTAQINKKLENEEEDVQENQSSGEVGKILGAFAASAARAIGSQVGRQIVRGILGAILGGGTKRRR